MKINNLKTSPKLTAMLLTGAITAAALTGCGNSTLIDTKYTFNKAIIFSDDSAVIIEIKKWKDYEDGEQLQLQTLDGAYILTSSYDTKLIDDRNSNMKAEDLVMAILGEDAEINYLNTEPKIKQK